MGRYGGDMRIPLLCGVLLLVAGCSSGTDTGAATLAPPLTPLTPVPSASAGVTTTSPTSRTAVPTAAPAAGTDEAAVAAWIDAGTRAEPDKFHTATRDGVATTLHEGVAFTTPGGQAQCMTDPKLGDGVLSCLLRLSDPAPRPIGSEGQWVPGWVDFTGTQINVGSLHADPGPFSVGAGPELPLGSALEFGDYRCRSDAAGLFCVNHAHQTAVKFSEAGIEPFGCLQRVDAPVDVGAKYSC